MDTTFEMQRLIAQLKEFGPNVAVIETLGSGMMSKSQFDVDVNEAFRGTSPLLLDGARKKRNNRCDNETPQACRAIQAMSSEGDMHGQSLSQATCMQKDQTKALLHHHHMQL